MAKRGNASLFNEQPIGDDLRDQIHDAIIDGKRLLKLAEAEADPEAIVTKVKLYVGRIPESGLKIEDKDIIALGCLWGQQICAALGRH